MWFIVSNTIPNTYAPTFQSYEGDNLVFFDFIGWYFISYSDSNAVIINYTTCAVVALGIILSLRSFAKSSG